MHDSFGGINPLYPLGYVPITIYLPIKAQNTGENTTEWQEQKGGEVCFYNCPETKKYRTEKR